MPASKSQSKALTVAVAAEAALRERLNIFRRRLREAASGKTSGDPEAIHQLRVASRRARAALELFAEQVSPKHQAWFLRLLRRARKSVDGVRNLDVYSVRHFDRENQPEVPREVRKLVRQRRKQLLPKVAAIDREFRKSGRLAKKQKKLLAGIQESQRNTTALRDFAKVALQPVRDAFMKAARSRDASPEHLHELRISAKQLRYTLELLSDVLPAAHEKLLGELTLLQDRLGAINDHATAMKLTSELETLADDKSVKRWLKQQRRAEREGLANSQAKFLQGWTLRQRKHYLSLCESCLAPRSPRKKSTRKLTKRK